MLRMDISSLRRSELRNLLTNARARGQDDLARQLEAELSARADERPAVPMETRTWDTHDDEVLPMALPEAGLELEFEPAARPERRRRRPVGLLAAVVLIGGGAAVAWGLRPVEPTAPSTASRSPSPANGGDFEVTRPTIPEPPPPAGEGNREVVEGAVIAAGSSPPTEATALAVPKPEPQMVAKAEPARERPTRLDPCAKPPSPADRALCGDLGLNLLDHEMREAYGRAMEAGADPVALRDGQAAFRRARDPLSDPRALAALYDRRIGELKAAAGAPAN